MTSVFLQVCCASSNPGQEHSPVLYFPVRYQRPEPQPLEHYSLRPQSRSHPWNLFAPCTMGQFPEVLGQERDHALWSLLCHQSAPAASATLTFLHLFLADLLPTCSSSTGVQEVSHQSLSPLYSTWKTHTQREPLPKNTPLLTALPENTLTAGEVRGNYPTAFKSQPSTTNTSTRITTKWRK